VLQNIKSHKIKKIVKTEEKSLETSIDKSDIFPNGSMNGEAPAILRERINNENKIEFMNYIRNNYPQNLYGKLKRNFYDEVIEIDLMQTFDGKERYFFFDIDKVNKVFNSMFDKIIEQNPFLFESIKEDLKNYSNEFQIDIYKEKELNIAENIYKSVYYFFKSDQNEVDIQNRNKGKKLAYLISQLKNIISLRNSGEVFILTLSADLKDKGFCVYRFPILKEIHDEIENMRSSNDEQCINLLYEKDKSLFNKIDNDKENSNTNKIIFKMYLTFYSNKKLLLLEDIMHNMPDDILYKIYNFRKNINDRIISFGFERKTNQNYFFDIEFPKFKIIRETLFEKEIFLEKGKNLNDFLDKLNNDFNSNVTQILLSIDENDNLGQEENLSFIKKYLKNIEKQDNLKDEIQKKIDELKKQKTKDYINVGKVGFKFIFDYTRPRKGIFEFFGKKPDENIIREENSLIENACVSKQNGEIANREILKLEKLLKNIEVNKEIIVKIIKECDLKTQIENIIKENGNRNIIGIIINQKINDKEDRLRDIYNVSSVN
jgi:hypothetical protein